MRGVCKALPEDVQRSRNVFRAAPDYGALPAVSCQPTGPPAVPDAGVPTIVRPRKAPGPTVAQPSGSGGGTRT